MGGGGNDVTTRRMYSKRSDARLADREERRHNILRSRKVSCCVVAQTTKLTGDQGH